MQEKNSDSGNFLHVCSVQRESKIQMFHGQNVALIRNKLETFSKITSPPYKKNILKIATQKTPTKNAFKSHSINKTFQLLTTKSIKQTQHCCDVINHK